MLLCLSLLIIIDYYAFILFILSSGVECKAFSHICGRLYLSMFLFKVGLFTLAYCFFYQPRHIVPFPAYNYEVVH